MLHELTLEVISKRHFFTLSSELDQAAEGP
jgi:hypothetical protein